MSKEPNWYWILGRCLFCLNRIKKHQRNQYNPVIHIIVQQSQYFLTDVRPEWILQALRPQQPHPGQVQGEAAGAGPVCHRLGGEDRRLQGGEAPGLLQDARHPAPSCLLQHHLQLIEHSRRPPAKQETSVLLWVSDFQPHQGVHNPRYCSRCHSRSDYILSQTSSLQWDLQGHKKWCQYYKCRQYFTHKARATDRRVWEL